MVREEDENRENGSCQGLQFSGLWQFFMKLDTIGLATLWSKQ